MKVEDLWEQEATSRALRGPQRERGRETSQMWGMRESVLMRGQNFYVTCVSITAKGLSFAMFVDVILTTDPIWSSMRVSTRSINFTSVRNAGKRFLRGRGLYVTCVSIPAKRLSVAMSVDVVLTIDPIWSSMRVSTRARNPTRVRRAGSASRVRTTSIVTKRFTAESNLTFARNVENRSARNQSWTGTSKTHNMARLGVKPHVCSSCGKGFTEKSNLRKHLKIHEREAK